MSSSRTYAHGCRGAVWSLAVVCLWAGIACGDRPPSGADAVAVIYDPCDPGTTVGAISVSQRSPWAEIAESTDVGWTSVSAGIRDGVNRDQWITTAVDGTCRLLDHPTCEPACTEPTFCTAGNRCVAASTLKDVGTISFHGLAVPLELTPFPPSTGLYYGSIVDPFPAAAPDTPITAETSGGDYAPFSLEARGVEELVFDGANLNFGRGRSLDFTWTAPARPSAARIQAVVELQPEVDGPKIECVFPDTGAASVPTSLLDSLLALGVNGWPHVHMARRTVASTNIAPGCVWLEVVARVTRDIAVDGVMNCVDDSECPPPLTCQTSNTCG